jgi:hypothetical protein
LNEHRRSQDKKKQLDAPNAKPKRRSSEKLNVEKARILAEAVVEQDGNHLITLLEIADTRGEKHLRSQSLILLPAR